MSRRGFTLIELLVVICILSILIALAVVAVSVGLDHSHHSATEMLLQNLSSAIATYAVRWGTFPPTSLTEIGGQPPNSLNNGIETLAACLSSRKLGPPCFQNDDVLCNTDNDHVDRNLTDWYWGDNELFEYKDYFGNVIIYFNAKDYVKPPKDVVRYRLSPDGEEVEVAPEVHPVTKSFVGAGRFQLRSAGKDGKMGTADDIRSP
jgi:prepilin-type N-terminal cleavage/methylation domain-containing protein